MNTYNALIPVDFDDLANWMVTIDSLFSPAGLHGAIVGGISGAMRLSAQRWTAFGLAVMGVDERLNDLQQANAQEVLGGLAQEQLNLLLSNDMEFNPFLPDDDETVEQRTEAMTQWCKGFLGGFAEAQLYRSRLSDAQVNDELPDIVMEVLRDITAIAQTPLETEDSEDAGELDIDEFEFADDSLLSVESEEFSEDSEERDYTEIVEYLRMAVLTVFTEYGWVESYDRTHSVQDKQKPNALGERLNAMGQPDKKTLH